MPRADLGLVVFLPETERRVVFVLLFLLLGVTAAEPLQQKVEPKRNAF